MGFQEAEPPYFTPCWQMQCPKSDSWSKKKALLIMNLTTKFASQSDLLTVLISARFLKFIQKMMFEYCFRLETQGMLFKRTPGCSSRLLHRLSKSIFCKPCCERRNARNPGLWDTFQVWSKWQAKRLHREV